MASLKCSDCGNGIHYHDEPDGTQYFVFPRSVWEKLTASELWVSRYILDGTNNYFTVWKCKKCGTIHVFHEDNPQLTAAFSKITVAVNGVPNQSDYIAISDYDWEQLTEKRIKSCDISDAFPEFAPISCHICKDTLYVCGKNSVISVYTKIVQQKLTGE